MAQIPILRVSDAAVVARYLQLRSHFHDRVLAKVSALVEERYAVRPTQRAQGALAGLVRQSYTRPGEGDLSPVVFMTPIDISLALYLQITPQRLAGLGTVLRGPQRSRHRLWDDWWGWEAHFDELDERFYDLAAADQEQRMVGWYDEKLEWLVAYGLMRKK